MNFSEKNNNVFRSKHISEELTLCRGPILYMGIQRLIRLAPVLFNLRSFNSSKTVYFLFVINA